MGALCLAAAGLPIAHPQVKTVSIEQFAFTPNEISVTLGDTVEWVNRDVFNHTTTADSAAWSSPEFGRGERFLLVTTQQGRFPYHCAAHPVMRGVLVVQGRR
jgi:plastocyanin